jgi:hypothetical protein
MAIPDERNYATMMWRWVLKLEWVDLVQSAG